MISQSRYQFFLSPPVYKYFSFTSSYLVFIYSCWLVFWVQWDGILVLICNFLVAKDFEHLWKLLLAICISSFLKNFLISSIANFFYLFTASEFHACIRNYFYSLYNPTASLPKNVSIPSLFNMSWFFNSLSSLSVVTVCMDLEHPLCHDLLLSG